MFSSRRGRKLHFRFGLTGLFGVVATCAILIAIWRLDPFAFAETTRLTSAFLLVGAIAYASPVIELLAKRAPLAAKAPLISLWYFVIVFSFYIFAGAVDQPHIRGWLLRRSRDGALVALTCGIAMLLFIGIDLAIQSRRSGVDADVAYYPRLSTVLQTLSYPRYRMALALGALLLIWYFAKTSVKIWRAHNEAGGLIWPPERLFTCCVVAWGVLWIVGCFGRPRRASMWVAIAFLACCLLAAPERSFVRE